MLAGIRQLACPPTPTPAAAEGQGWVSLRAFMMETRHTETKEHKLAAEHK